MNFHYIWMWFWAIWAVVFFGAALLPLILPPSLHGVRSLPQRLFQSMLFVAFSIGFGVMAQQEATSANRVRAEELCRTAAWVGEREQLMPGCSALLATQAQRARAAAEERQVEDAGRAAADLRFLQRYLTEEKQH